MARNINEIMEYDTKGQKKNVPWHPYDPYKFGRKTVQPTCYRNAKWMKWKRHDKEATVSIYSTPNIESVDRLEHET